LEVVEGSGFGLREIGFGLGGVGLDWGEWVWIGGIVLFLGCWIGRSGNGLVGLGTSCFNVKLMM
jgi:hypothetical protein